MGKLLVILAVLLLIGVGLLVVRNSGVTGNVVAMDAENLRRVDLAIENMYCEACAYGVKAQIEELDGVASAEINYKEGTGFAFYDPSKVDAETIAAASTAYPARVV